MEPLNLLEERFRHAKDESSPKKRWNAPEAELSLKETLNSYSKTFIN